MIKKILPAMIGVALAGGMTAALADVTVMGHLDQSITRDDIDGGTDDTNFTCTTCSIGFKGSEDLGNGLKAIFKLDFQFDMNERNSGGSITDRDQWLGLAGNFGQARVGTISTPYKSYGAQIDPLYRTALQGRDHALQSSMFHSGAGEDIEGRADNTLRYDSPSWNGLKVAAFYTLDSNEDDGILKDPTTPSKGNKNEDDNPYGVGVSYQNGGILAFGAWQTNNGGNNNRKGELTAYKAGGKWTVNNFAVMGQYENANQDATNTDYYHWTLAASYTMGNNMLYAGYGMGNVDGRNIDDEDVTAFTIAGVHNMSKRTSVYLGYTAADCDARMTETGKDKSDPPNDTGYKYTYVSACSDVKENGGDNTRIALGLKHKF
jgi:predicted porin